MNTAVILKRETHAVAERALSPRTVIVGLVLILLTALTAFLVTRDPAAAAPRLAVTKPMRDQLRGMSTGAHQALIVSGETAQSRNAEIPLAGGPLAKMAALTVVPAASPQYATALKCLTQAVYYEAANEPELGKRAVAQVVINRLRHPAFPNSVCGVVYQGANAPVCQFSFTCDGSLLRRPMARQWAEAQHVAADALRGTVVPQVGSATNYHADYVLPRWAFTLGKLSQIGAHIFYRFPGRIGSAAVFADAWNGSEHIPALNMERLRLAAAAEQVEDAPEIALAPNLTVPADVKDRHAEADVGGRLDMTTNWRLSIPDPVELSAGYRSTVTSQSDDAIASEARAAN